MSESARSILKHLYKEGRMTEEQYQKIDRNLKERPHGEWIPCSEWLPEEIGDYLVTEHLSDIAQAVYVSSFGYVRTGELCFYYEDDDGRAIKNDGIVAWMPLPEPYKEEGGEE